MMNNNAKLKQVLSIIKEVVADHKLPIVIFDLDDTFPDLIAIVDFTMPSE
jgi:hypothetical protein